MTCLVEEVKLSCRNANHEMHEQERLSRVESIYEKDWCDWYESVRSEHE